MNDATHSGAKMTTLRTYSASCHCGAVRFTFNCEEITSGRRCNCSICIRKGVVMSAAYLRPSDVDVEGQERLALYQGLVPRFRGIDGSIPPRLRRGSRHQHRLRWGSAPNPNSLREFLAHRFE